MKTVDGRWVFDDGTPVRLVATMQGTPRDKKESEYTARWLAKYGFNLVRIGHLVTGPEQDSAVDWSQPDSGHLNPKVMDQLDYFIAELAKRGIYSRPDHALVPQAQEGRRRRRLRRIGGLRRPEGRSAPASPARSRCSTRWASPSSTKGDAGQHRPGEGDHDPSQSVPRQQDRTAKTRPSPRSR